MSELQVTTIESNTVSANVITAGQTTVNSSGLYLNSTSGVINSSAIAVSNASGNVVLQGTMNLSYIFIGNNNVFPNSNDVFTWAGNAIANQNCLVSRDTTIEYSQYGGIPIKIIPTGTDPFPGTYNSSQWNLAPTIDGDVWKISGYIRVSADITIGDGASLLVLPANSSGVYGSAGTPSYLGALTLQGNTWTRFEFLSTISGNANTAYLQIRLDGEQTGTVTTWYDGITIEKGYKSLINETVNTQIFTNTSTSQTWTKPGWANTGNELVVVHMWGGGGGGTTGAGSMGGGGGAFVFGYFKASQCNAVCNVVVGAGGSKGTSANGISGNNSIFWSNSTVSLVAYGGGGALNLGSGTHQGGGGGGWISAGISGNGGGPLGGTVGPTGTVSTFGGGGGANNSSPFDGGASVYGGGGGGGVDGGISVYGGGGGGGGSLVSPLGGNSIFGGKGGSGGEDGLIPGGGGGANSTASGNGARGEVRVYTYRILA